MENKKIRMEILAAVFAFVMMLMSASNVTAEDSWNDITDLSQADGTWKATVSQTATEGDMDFKVVVEMTMIIDADTETVSASMKMTIIFTGSDDYTWQVLKAEAADAEEDLIIDDKRRSITMPETAISTESISLSDMDELKINQDGTKMRGYDHDLGEMIFTRGK